MPWLKEDTSRTLMELTAQWEFVSDQFSSRNLPIVRPPKCWDLYLRTIHSCTSQSSFSGYTTAFIKTGCVPAATEHFPPELQLTEFHYFKLISTTRKHRALFHWVQNITQKEMNRRERRENPQTKYHQDCRFQSQAAYVVISSLCVFTQGPSVPL